MHVRNPRFNQMIDPGFQTVWRTGAFLGESKVFSLVGYSRVLVDAEIAHMEFVNDHVGVMFRYNSGVGIPAVGIGAGEIADHAVTAVHPNGKGIRVGDLVHPSFVNLALNGVVQSVAIAFQFGNPNPGRLFYHLDDLCQLTGPPFVVGAEQNPGSGRRPKPHDRLLFRIGDAKRLFRIKRVNREIDIPKVPVHSSILAMKQTKIGKYHSV